MKKLSISENKGKKLFKLNLKPSIKKQYTFFIVIGLTSVLIDTCAYLLLFYLSELVNFSKFISFIAGAVFSYYGNKNITFSVKAKKSTPIYFSLVYLISLGLNIIVNNFSLYIFQNKEILSVIISFFIATTISAIFNFIMIKFFVFKKI